MENKTQDCFMVDKDILPNEDLKLYQKAPLAMAMVGGKFNYVKKNLHGKVGYIIPFEEMMDMTARYLQFCKNKGVEPLNKEEYSAFLKDNGYVQR